MRIDTWLWATRHVKSRSQATSAARAGHVKINGESVKAAQKVRVGDEVRLRVEGFDRVLIVRKLLAKRLGYPFAKLCYEDLSEPRPRLGSPSPSENAVVGVRRRKSVGIWRNSVE